MGHGARFLALTAAGVGVFMLVWIAGVLPDVVLFPWLFLATPVAVVAADELWSRHRDRLSPRR